MSAPTAAPSRLAEAAAYAAAVFEREGLSVDRLVERLLDAYCADPAWVRGLVLEALREAALHAVRRTPPQLIIDVPAGAPASGASGASGPSGPAGPAVTAAPASPAPARDRPSGRRVRRAAAAELAAPPAWAKALGVDPTRRVLRPLLDLTREELLAGAGFLDGRAAVCRAVAARLRPGQRAGDVLSPAELAALEAELAAGTARKGVAG